jgi:hypothetical protein
MELGTTMNRRRDEMSKKLITTISLVFALAVAGASTALADPPADRAANGQGVAGVCNMLNVGGSAVEFAGMDNSAHGQGYDIMKFDLIIPACFS